MTFEVLSHFTFNFKLLSDKQFTVLVIPWITL